MNIRNKQEKGFTIIEVVLVLAIAGLIFLMVFLALPALQRSQRDTQRKNDLSRAITAVTSFVASNRGELPTFDEAFVNNYLITGDKDTFIDPSGSGDGNTDNDTKQYEFKPHDGSVLSVGFDTDQTQNIIYFSEGFTCGSGGTFVDAGSRKVALAMYLEGGGVACQNN